MVHKKYHISQQRTVANCCKNQECTNSGHQVIQMTIRVMGHQYRTCFVSLFQCVEFLKICGPLAKTDYHITKYSISYFMEDPYIISISYLSFSLSHLSHHSFFCRSEMAMPTEFCKLWGYF
jgi:hypothetical protein